MPQAAYKYIYIVTPYTRTVLLFFQALGAPGCPHYDKELV